MARSFVSRAEMQGMRNAAVAEMQNKAHERHMMGRANFAQSNPHALPPTETRGLMDWKRDQGLTKREEALHNQRMAMLEMEQKTRLGEAAAKRDGMIGQGRDAAHAQWGQMIDGKFIPGGQAAIAELNNQGALERSKLEDGWTDDRGNRHHGSKEIISAGELAARKELGEMQFGKIAPDGTVSPGANERVETIRGDAAERAARAQAETIAQKMDLERQKMEANKEARLAKVKADLAKTKGADKTKLIQQMLKLGDVTKEEAFDLLNPSTEEQQKIPGYSPEKVAEHQKRGYKWNGENWIKSE